MRKYTLRELRELVRLGMAVNITEADPKSGNYYALTARSSNLFYFF